jgi:DDE superfamily endonuclease
MDNGSSHRGQACMQRLQRRWPTIIPVHTPVHASWLNQIEVYFSIVQRKVLTPNYFRSLAEVRDRLLCFQDHYCATARPFQWKFSREDLKTLLAKIRAHELNFRKQLEWNTSPNLRARVLRSRPTRARELKPVQCTASIAVDTPMRSWPSTREGAFDIMMADDAHE